ncbi:MAG: ribosome small subunit-dependent GTPase A [Bacilli bacterium]|nr:ribosome small subunit-dependent GTPase A [Bacilli bacterium]
MPGVIIGVNCGTYTVNYQGVNYQASARGVFRNLGIKPVVGDLVDFDDNNFVITKVYERQNYLKRPLIANIDQLLIVESVLEPEFSYLLAFKYLTYANMHNLKAKIILTKIDKLKDLALIDEIKKVFLKFEVEVYPLSNIDHAGVNEVKSLFANHITALIGQTGVGKSSLINSLDENYERAIGEYSKALGRGKHQTKEVILLPYENGYIADTPGFSSLDLELYKEDLAEFYPGFAKFYGKCFFNDCLHINEKNCLIKEMVASGQYPKVAYDCYLKLSNQAINKFKRFEK